ncbi:MAG: PEP-CTERM sorting domain-containing protein [Cephaloticoccus sp.]|nr:PEP-CTERM sorting domain-containing protein [Cephaloticoccus sp.]
MNISNPCSWFRFLRLIRLTSVLAGALGSAAAFGQVIVSNLSESGGSASSDTYLANSFTTDATVYPLRSVTIDIGYVNASGASSFTLNIYSDNAGAIGSLLETLSGTGSPTVGQHTYSSTGLALAGNTTYWVVAYDPNYSVGGGAHTSYLWSGTSSANETSSGAGWTIADSYFRGASLGSLSSSAGSFKFSVNASAAVPEPSTYAAILGACALGFVSFRRYRSKRAA